jgi:hypothetical protein
MCWSPGPGGCWAPSTPLVCTIMFVSRRALTVIAFTIDAGRIAALDVMRNPGKLGGVHSSPGLGPGRADGP